MSVKDLKQAIPDYAKDLRLNIGSVLDEDTLTPQQRYGVFLASALASRNETVIKAASEEAEGQLSDEAKEAAKAAAAIMGMNNIYYRFLHLTSSADDYKNLPAKLRMNVIAKPGIEKVDFELYSLAVSAVNGCGMCVDSHEAVVRKAGLRPEQIQAAVRIAAVTHALAQTLDGEAALSA